MNFIQLNENFDLKKHDFCGSESKLYIVGNDLYKLYNTNNVSSIYHLLCLTSKQRNLKGTVLPTGIILENDKLAGVQIPYFEGYKTLSSLTELSNKTKISIIKLVLKNLEELTNNGIYPMDFNIDGILVSGNDAKIVDLDTYTTEIANDSKKERLAFVLRLYLNIILELIYPDFILKPLSKKLEDYLVTKMLNQSIINDICGKTISYSTLSNFIDSIKVK